MNRMLRSMGFVAVAALATPSVGLAQTAPQIAYVYPPGAPAGSQIEVALAGYDWTPDMQFFVHDPRVRLEVLGPPGEVLVPDPPFWFGPKSFTSALPLPREVPARLTVPPDMPPGMVEWQAANANGTTAVGQFVIGAGSEVLEATSRKEPQTLPQLPITVSGRLERIEEVDRYRITSDSSGPITCELQSRLGLPFNGVIEVRDSNGTLIADVVDTQGIDSRLTFTAEPGKAYAISVNDLDFRGNRAFVYRLQIRRGPRLLGAIPAAGRPGETREFEFVGLGVATGDAVLESVRREVAIPSDPAAESFDYKLQTDFGESQPWRLIVSGLPEAVESSEPSSTHQLLKAPGAVTGTLDVRGKPDRYLLESKKDETWNITVQAQRLGSPLDPVLVIRGPDGVEIAKNDDLPGTADSGVDFTAPAEGRYELQVSDLSGTSATRAALYRLVVRPASELTADFKLEAPRSLNVPLSGKAELTITASRLGQWKGPITVALKGLASGITVPEDLVIAPEQGEIKIPLKSQEDAPVIASSVSLSGIGEIDGRQVTHHLPPCVVALTMKPRAKVTPVDKDGGRTVHAGTTYPAEVIIERLEGFEGEIRLEMSSQQSRHRQGIRGPERVVPPGVDRTFYPVFMPEWLETNRTSRMILNAAVQVPDPQGNLRHLLNRMDGRITMSVEGPLLRVAQTGQTASLTVVAEPFEIPLRISRSAKLPEPVRLELVLPEALQGHLVADPIMVASGQDQAVLRVVPVSKDKPVGKHVLKVRAIALQQLDALPAEFSRLPVIAECEVSLYMHP